MGFAFFATAPIGRANNIEWIGNPPLTAAATAMGDTTLTVTVTVRNNSGSDWGENHYIGMRDSTGAVVALGNLDGVVDGETVTRELYFGLPNAPGTVNYTYSFQALEHNNEWFGPIYTHTVAVTQTPPYAGMQLSATTFSLATPPNISTTDSVVTLPYWRLRAKVIDGSQYGWHMANEWIRNNYPVDSMAPPGNYAICALYWVTYSALGGNVVSIGPERREAIVVQHAVDLTEHSFHVTTPPRIRFGGALTGNYRLFAQFANAQGTWETAGGSNNNHARLTALPPAGTYQVSLYYQRFDGGTLVETSPPRVISSTISAGPMRVLEAGGYIGSTVAYNDVDEPYDVYGEQVHYFGTSTAGTVCLRTTGVSDLSGSFGGVTGTEVLTETPLTVAAGDWQSVIVTGTTGGGYYEIFGELTPSVIAPTITSSPTAAAGAVGTAYPGYTVVASGTGPFVFATPEPGALNALPPGLTINSGTGAVTGTPTAAGTYTTWITAANAAGSGGRWVTFSVASDAPHAFAAEQITDSRFLASWVAVPGATGYRLDVASDSAFTTLVLNNYAPVFIFNGQSTIATSHTVTGLAPNTNYWYRVRAIRGAVTTANSTPIAVHTSASVPGAPSLWLDKPVDVRDLNGNWIKVYDGVPDEIIPSDGPHGLTSYILDWRDTGGTISFDEPVNDWWSPRNVFFDTDGNGSWDISRSGFTPWWLSGFSISYPGTVYLRLGVEFDPEPGYDYEICYSQNDILSPSSLSVVNGGGHIFAENATRMIIALFNEFTEQELDRGSLYLVRYAKPPTGVQLNFPTIGNIALHAGPGGTSGVATLPGNIQITATNGSATVTAPGAGTLTIDGTGTVSGSVSLPGGYVLGGVSNGSLNISGPNGVIVSTGPGRTAVTIPGGTSIAINGSGGIGMSVPSGGGPSLSDAINALGGLLGQGVTGPGVRATVVSSGSPPDSGVWQEIGGLILGNNPSGDYDVGVTSDTRSTPAVENIVWLTVRVLAPPTGSITGPPYMWINDDDDSGTIGGDDIPGNTSPNYADVSGDIGVVDGVRDLVDFFPVTLNIREYVTRYPPDANVRYVLKHAGSAVNFVYSNLSPTNASNYHRQLLSSGFGDSFSQPPGEATTHRVTAAGHVLSGAFLSLIGNGTGGVILLEGRSQTTDPLVVSVENTNGTVYGTMQMPLRVSPVESMFRHINLSTVNQEYDGTSITPSPAAQPARSGDPGWPFPDSATNGKYFVFVHGYNVDGRKARGWNCEIFKRLHQLGSRARFVGVTWHGATGLDYHKAVYHSFQSGNLFGTHLAFAGISGDVTIAAHSLGNMLVSHAIASGGFLPTRYYMINGAVPIEAYDNGNVDAAQRLAMTEEDWKSRGSRFFAANWHELFAPPDNRSGLTWKERFAAVLPIVYNFYSPGEEVVAKAETSTASVMVTILRQGFNVSRGAWTAQELVKGVNWTTSMAELFMERKQAGWNAQILKYGYNPGPEVTDAELRIQPYFERFLESDLMHPVASVASAKAGSAKVNYDLMARAIPALSYATAVDRVLILGADRNINMESVGRTPGVWPTDGHSDRNVGRWLHSDFRNVALPYVQPMFQEMILRGGLQL